MSLQTVGAWVPYTDGGEINIRAAVARLEGRLAELGAARAGDPVVVHDITTFEGQHALIASCRAEVPS